MLQSMTIIRYEALRDKLPDDFSRAVLEGALRVLSDDNNPIRGNLFALGAREMMRHVLERQAPDEAVRACAWFQASVEQRRQRKEEKPEQITRRDRMIYATQGGISDATLEELNLDPGSMHKKLGGVIRSLSKFAHVQPETMLGAPSATDSLVDGVLDVVADFLDRIVEFRNEVAQAVSEAVNTEALNAFMMEAIGELDELSTHTQVNDAEVEELGVINIDPRFVTLKGRGTVYALLIYGSGSDERRGDGARMRGQYPFEMTIAASTEDLTAMTIGVLGVDTSSFRDGDDDE